MSDFAAIALLALAPGDILPAHVRPLLDADSDRMAWTVTEYCDTTVTHWRYAGEVVPVIESPGEGEVLVLIVPMAGEGTSTGVAELPPTQPEEIRHEGCGKMFTWED